MQCRLPRAQLRHTYVSLYPLSDIVFSLLFYTVIGKSME
jgi:hypothetical protein